MIPFSVTSVDILLRENGESAKLQDILLKEKSLLAVNLLRTVSFVLEGNETVYYNDKNRS